MLFIHIEEPSMEIALNEILPKMLLGREVSWKIIQHGSKQKLLVDLSTRLAGYRRMKNLGEIRVLVLVDRDGDDCRVLKSKLEKISLDSGFWTKSKPSVGGDFQVVNRIVIEELESWFFGDIDALRCVYPKIPSSLGSRATYRNPDGIKGGTWEALLRVLRESGYYTKNASLPKLEVAQLVAPNIDIVRNKSPSFRSFVDGIESLL